MLLDKRFTSRRSKDPRAETSRDAYSCLVTGCDVRYDEQMNVNLLIEVDMREATLEGGVPSLEQAVSVGKSLSDRLYTIPELMRLSGLTRKKVVYWERIGLVSPSMRSLRISRRQPCVFYSSSEVLKALVICELLRLRLSLKQVQQLARNLSELDVDLYGPETYLLTDGYSIYYASSDGQVVDVHRHHRQMLLLVPLHEQVAKLKGAA